MAQLRKRRQSFCSSNCLRQWLRERARTKLSQKYPDRYGPVTVICAQCGVSFEKKRGDVNRGKKMGSRFFCSKRCRGQWQSENFSGSIHPQWRGGSRGYGRGWFVNRKAAFARDGGYCMACGAPGQHVHHIRTFAATRDNRLNNLITLCVQHHNEAHNSCLAKGILRGILSAHYGYVYEGADSNFELVNDFEE